MLPSPTRVDTPQSRLVAGAARGDITPPAGIYHRTWGAAVHERATGVHRPLTATVLWLAPPPEPAAGRVVASLDHCLLDPADMAALRRALAEGAGVPAEHVQLTLTHTHGSGWISRTRSQLPGGELIGPYFDALAPQLAALARAARSAARPATLVYGAGRCSLAAFRDFYDGERGHAVCGFQPAGYADDTLLVGRLTAESGETLATLVNYACHPTTLAWDNTRLSPDWVGAMREAVETHAGGLCLFLQGASGDLGPREGFVGDAAVADRNGRQVGFAALAALEALPPPGTSYRYAGPVVSGTLIGVWRHEPLAAAELTEQAAWKWREIVVPLPYRHDLPTIEETTRERERQQRGEEAARAAGDAAGARDCRARVEQMTRQLARLEALPPGRCYPLSVTLGVLGDAIWVFTPGELYQVFQRELRARFAPRPVLVATHTNNWQPGYVPPAATYGYGVYQEIIAATAAGDLELLIEAVTRELRSVLG